MFEERVKTTISCKDCEHIPKATAAGTITEDGHQIMHNGVKIIKGSYHGDWMTKIIQETKGHHEPQEEKAFYEVLESLQSPATMIELGSNWAYYSMWFNKKIQDSRNMMIEPTIKKLQAGRDNFKINNMQGEFFHAFVGRDSEKNAKFVDWDGKVYTLDRICIDDFCKSNNIDHVDVVHSDIQGAEYEMLLGSKNMIEQNKIDHFFISTHISDNLHNKCRDFLTENGYKILCEHTIRESYSADGLIVASRTLDKKITISKRGTV